MSMEDQDRLATVIGRNITRLRKMANMTQLELAEKLNYSDKSVSKWEQGNGVPDVRILIRLADLFGVTVDDLVHEHVNGDVVPKNTRRLSRMITLVCSSGLCWLVAVVCFVLMALFRQDLSYKWLAFVFAVPANAIVVLVFSCVWHWKWVRVVSISVLIWTSLGCIYLVAFALLSQYAPDWTGNLWLLFLIGIPLQLLALFYFVWRKGARSKG